MEKEQLGRCTYCLRRGRKRNLRPLPKELADQRSLFCPDCYPGVLKEVKNLPWNKERF